MLHELRIKDLAIIDDLALTFRPGLNVITGETGTGKSIILQGLALLCGWRASANVVRTEAEGAAVDGVFDPPPAELLDAVGIAADDALVVRRVLSRAGKTRAYVNGSPVTTTVLTRLGTELVHIYGQHEQALLLRPESHIDFLDRFADLGALRAQMAVIHGALSAARRHRATLVRDHQEREHRRELMEFQRHELRAAAVEPDEEERLRREREIARHAERLRQVCHAADSELYAGEQDIVGALGRIGGQLRDVAAIDPGLGEAAELIDSARNQLDEAARVVRTYATRVDGDPERLAQIEERLALITRLARRHGVESTELPGVLDGLEQELQALDHAEEALAAAGAAVAVCQARALAVARQLSDTRARAARRLESLAARELAALGMRGALVRVVQETAAGDAEADPDATGIDTIEFHLAANPGEAARPLAEVASGGELSRIMLALKTLTATVNETPVLIFDEVDAGIGGAVADAVARRLKLLARTRQLLCITHLPQIAAYADHHIAVEKRVERGRTVTRARLLAPGERVAEVARMLGGGTAPPEAERYARRLIAQAAGLHRTERRVTP